MYRREPMNARWLGTTLVLGALVLAPLPALAAGTITPSRTDLTESDGSWKLFLTVKLGKKPPTPHQSFRFIWKQTVLYETFLDDQHGDAEQTRSIPRPDAEPLVVSMDVNFGDVKGQIWETTKFDFAVRRDNNFEAGEYKVEVRDGDNHTIGQPFTIKLAGKNTTIDRRAIIMTESKKKKKPAADDAAKGDDKKGDDKKDAAKDNAAASDAPKDTANAKRGGEGEDAAAPPPPVEPKKGGCGCEVPGGSAPTLPVAPMLGLAAFVALFRRRR